MTAYSQVQALTGFSYCRELADQLAQWADSFAEEEPLRLARTRASRLAREEPAATARARELVEKVDGFLKRIHQTAPEQHGQAD